MPAPQRQEGQREFVFCEVFSFTGDAASRLDTYYGWLSSPSLSAKN
jgi:hypothetical protein